MEAYRIIMTGSIGNCIIYFNSILIDIGIPYSRLKPYAKDIQIVLLTHAHGDHINIKTLQRLQKERPSLRIGCGEWMLPYLEGIKNVDVYEIGKIYDYGQFKVSPFKLYHDVENVGYRLFKDDKKVFHATDTKTLQGISAAGYDVYCIESNYSEPVAEKMIKEAIEKGEFTHIIGSINSHLSEEQCNDFYYNNKSQHSKLIRLHETRSYL